MAASREPKQGLTYRRWLRWVTSCADLASSRSRSRGETLSDRFSYCWNSRSRPFAARITFQNQGLSRTTRHREWTLGYPSHNYPARRECRLSRIKMNRWGLERRAAGVVLLMDVVACWFSSGGAQRESECQTMWSLSAVHPVLGMGWLWRALDGHLIIALGGLRLRPGTLSARDSTTDLTI